LKTGFPYNQKKKQKKEKGKEKEKEKTTCEWDDGDDENLRIETLQNHTLTSSTLSKFSYSSLLLLFGLSICNLSSFFG